MMFQNHFTIQPAIDPKALPRVASSAWVQWHNDPMACAFRSGVREHFTRVCYTTLDTLVLSGGAQRRLTDVYFIAKN